MINEISVIQQKLDAYRRKFYLNQLVRGGIIFLLVVISSFILFSVSEGFLWLSVTYRTILFFLLSGITIGVFSRYVAYPFFKIQGIGKVLTQEEIAIQVGKHFPDIDDRLLNLLQLYERQKEQKDNSLLVAAIEEKTSLLRVIPFTNAINLKLNYRYARYLLLPLFLLLFIFGFQPDLLTKGSYRLFNFRSHFEPPPPFDIDFLGLPDAVVHGDSLPIRVTTKGNILPQELFLYYKFNSEETYNQLILKKISPTDFITSFKSVTQDIDFYVGNELVKSSNKRVKVHLRPSISNFQVVVQPPAYTRLPAETLQANRGDFDVLKGSGIAIAFEFKGDVQQAVILTPTPVILSNSKPTFKKTVMQDFSYQVSLKSSVGLTNLDTIHYQIKVLDDKYPSINVTQPSSEFVPGSSAMMPIQLEATDDYGISKLELLYKFTKTAVNNKVTENYRSLNLPISPYQPYVFYSKSFDLLQIDFAEGEEVEFLFKVTDNDAVSGFKSTTSSIYRIKMPSQSELYDEQEKTQENSTASIDEIKKEAMQLNKEYEELQKKFTEKKQLTYEDKKQAQELLKKQMQLQERFEAEQKRIKTEQQKSAENNLFDEQTLKKYEQLQQLMQEFMTPEMREYLKKMQENLEKMDLRQFKQEIDKIKQQNEDFAKDLERTLELFNQLKVEQKIDQLINKIDALEKKQEMLAEQTKNAKSPEELKQIQEKQKQLEEEMKNIKNDIQELKDQKEKTQTPDKDEMNKLDEQANDAEKNMKDASDNLSKNSKSQANKSQNESKKKLNDMKQMLSNMKQSDSNEQDEENYEDLRNLLENLLKLSFDQEDLRDQVKKIRFNDPSLQFKLQKQKALKDDMVMLKDSLFALSKRVLQIKKFVTDEVNIIQNSMNRVIMFLTDKQIPQSVSEQHFVMTSLNNLANMLTESLEQMQQQMKNSQQGGGSCSKPGGKKPSMRDVAKMQQQLNKELGEMMKNGTPDPKKLAEYGARQEMIRQQMKEAYEKIKQEQGEKGLGSADKIMEDMQKTEIELMNQQLSHEMLMRQQQILSRMLDFDKSVREREFDEKRESNSGKENYQHSTKELDVEKIKQRIRNEIFNTTKFQYTPEYKELIDQYFRLVSPN